MSSTPSPASSPSTSVEPPSPRAARALTRIKLAIVALVAAFLLGAYWAGLFDIFSEPVRIKEALVGLGPWGLIAFVVAYACLQPFGVPGTVFILAAPLIWPWPVAFAVSMAGTMAASVVGFSFARFVARDWVAKWVPARFRAYDESLAQRAFFTVLTLRFIFWMPPMLHVFFGISRVSFWTHFWGSLVGYIVPLLATAYFGQKVFDYLRHAPPSVWIAMFGTFFAIVSTLWFIRRRSVTRPEKPIEQSNS